MSWATRAVLGPENVRHSEAVDRLCRKCMAYRFGLVLMAGTIAALVSALVLK